MSEARLRENAIPTDVLSALRKRLRRLNRYKLMNTPRASTAPLEIRQITVSSNGVSDKTKGKAARNGQLIPVVNIIRMESATIGWKLPVCRAKTKKILMNPVNAIEISAVVSRNE